MKGVFWKPKLAGALGIIPALFVLAGAAASLLNAKNDLLNLLGLVFVVALLYFFICLILYFTPEEKTETVQEDNKVGGDMAGRDIHRHGSATGTSPTPQPKREKKLSREQRKRKNKTK